MKNKNSEQSRRGPKFYLPSNVLVFNGAKKILENLKEDEIEKGKYLLGGVGIYDKSFQDLKGFKFSDEVEMVFDYGDVGRNILIPSYRPNFPEVKSSGRIIKFKTNSLFKKSNFIFLNYTNLNFLYFLNEDPEEIKKGFLWGRRAKFGTSSGEDVFLGRGVLENVNPNSFHKNSMEEYEIGVKKRILEDEMYSLEDLGLNKNTKLPNELKNMGKFLCGLKSLDSLIRDLCK